ncbi:hypothetical protein IIB50_01380 [Patescibacteria group bacterium]|nr:hypothetical protein [Patescibacteria group bacterium]
MIEIIPAVMPKNLNDLESVLSRLVKLVPLIQIDVMDGKFVPSKNFPYEVGTIIEFKDIISGEKKFPFIADIDFEVDLMVDKPEEVIDDWIDIGARRIIVHIESAANIKNILRDVIAKVTESEDSDISAVEIGLAINTTTSNNALSPYITDIDFVQFMGIEKIGYQGQPFDERVIQKIVDLHRAHPEIIISVDGGVTLETAPSLIKAGANRLVSGSAILQSDDIEETIEQFKTLKI